MRNSLTWLLAIGLAVSSGCKRGEDAAITGPDTPPPVPPVASAKLEKTELKLGWPATIDAAPIVIALQKGFFTDEGLSVQSNIAATEALAAGQLDGAAVLASQPVGTAVGDRNGKELVTPLTLSRGGGYFTISAKAWDQIKGRVRRDANGEPVYPIEADCLASAQWPLEPDNEAARKHPSYSFSYWLNAANLPVMAKTISEGYPPDHVLLVANAEIWPSCPTAVFACTKEWSEKHPNTLVAITKALIRACQWLESEGNRPEVAKLLANAVSKDEAVILAFLSGVVRTPTGGERNLPERPRFFRQQSTAPLARDGVWFLTQMARWDESKSAKPDSWYHELAEKTYLRATYEKAAKQLIQEGKCQEADFPLGGDGYGEPATDFMDGCPFDARQPNAYLKLLGHPSPPAS